ncbi:transposase-like protein [Bradyrhizobium sp. F1.13.3]
MTRLRAAYLQPPLPGIHLEARLEDEKQCILVLIGATPEGRKELVGFTEGARESAHDWRDLLLD